MGVALIHIAYTSSGTSTWSTEGLRVSHHHTKTPPPLPSSLRWENTLYPSTCHSSGVICQGSVVPIMSGFRVFTVVITSSSLLFKEVTFNISTEGGYTLCTALQGL